MCPVTSDVVQNVYPDKLSAWRHVVYTCYQPRSMASAEDLRLKAQAWREHQITTHLPARNVRVYDADFAKREPPSRALGAACQQPCLANQGVLGGYVGWAERGGVPGTSSRGVVRVQGVQG